MSLPSSLLVAQPARIARRLSAPVLAVCLLPILTGAAPLQARAATASAWSADSGRLKAAQGTLETFANEVKLQADDGYPGDAFGLSVAIDGDMAVVGAPYQNSFEGAAYIYEREGADWSLRNVFGVSGSGWLGYSVALRGDTILIGAPATNVTTSREGAAYVLSRSGGVWQPQATLTAADGQPDDRFGWSVALDDAPFEPVSATDPQPAHDLFAIVGAPYRNTPAVGPNSGAAYTYGRATPALGSGWSSLGPPLIFDQLDVPGLNFGWAVAVRGPVAAVGAPGDFYYGLNSGSASIFVRVERPAGWEWELQGSFRPTASQADPYAYFGESVALSGDGRSAVVGAPGDVVSVGASGSAYVFTFTGTWQQRANLVPPGATAGSWYGASVSLARDGGSLLVGSSHWNSDVGAGFLYEGAGALWTLRRKLEPSDAASGDVEYFGSDVELSGATAIIGAGTTTLTPALQGAAYIYQSPPVDLAIEKWSRPNPVAPGQELFYTIGVTNRTSNQTAHDVVVTDVLPDEVDYLADTGGCTRSLVTGALACELGDLGVGGRRTFEIKTRVHRDVLDADPTATLAISNTASVSTSDIDLDPTNDVAVERTLVEALVDLNITKTGLPDPVAAGGTLTYRIAVENRMPGVTATGVRVTDTLPAGVTYVGDTDDCDASGLPSLVCRLDDLAPFAPRELEIMVRAPSDVTGVGVISNTASVGSLQSDAQPADNSVTIGTFVDGDYDLSIEKTVVSDPVMAGQTATFGITVHNHGTAVAATNVVVSDTLPAGTLYVGDTGGCAQTAGSPSLPDLTCDLGELRPGASRSFSVTVLVPPDAAVVAVGETPVIANSAVVTGDQAEMDVDNNRAEARAVVAELADLRITKVSNSGASVQAGERFSYTIFVDNLGPSAAQQVHLRDNILASGGFSLVAVHDDPNRTADACTPRMDPSSGQEWLECDLNEPLEPQGVSAGLYSAGRWQIRIIVHADETREVANVATVFTDADGTPDPGPSNNQATVFVRVQEIGDLAITSKSALGQVVGSGGAMTEEAGRVTAGMLVTYTVTISNFGPSVGRNVVVEELLPSPVEVVSLSGLSLAGAAACTVGTPGNADDPSRCRFDTLPAVEEGNVGVLTVVVRVRPDAWRRLPPGEKLLFNDVWIHGDTADTNNRNDAGHAPVAVTSYSELHVEKLADPHPVVAGEVLTYRIEVGNNGPSMLHNLQLSDALQSGGSHARFLGFDFENASGTCFFTDYGAPTVSCSLGDVAVDGTRQVYLRFQIDPATPDGTHLTDEVSSRADSTIGFSPDSDFTEDVEVVTSADLAVEKWSDPVKVFAGEQKTYTIRIRSNGPSDARNVTVTEVLPPEVTYEIDTANCALTGTDPQTGGQMLSCANGTMAPGQTWQFEVWVRVLPGTAPDTTIANTATVTSETSLGDPVAANNAATTRDLVLQKADLKVVKFGKPDGQVRAGDILTYTVIVDNLGPSWATDAALKDVLQSSLDFELLDVTSDVAMSCSSLPAGAPSRIPVVDQRLQIDCTLLDPLAVLAVGEESPPNPGRWVLTVRVRARQTQDINNVAEVTSPAYDPDPSNNGASVEHEITDVADLGVTIAAPAQVTAGTSIRYSLTVTNSGPSTAENVVLTDRLPVGVTVTGLTVSQGSCATGMAGSAVDRLTCGLGSILPNGSATAVVSVLVDPRLATGRILENDAFVTSDVFDPTIDNNYASVLTTVQAVADLRLRKTAVGPLPWIAGERRTYEYDLANLGPSVSRHVKLIDALPAEVDFRSAFMALENQAGGVGLPCTVMSNNVLVCPLGDVPLTGTLAAGQSPVSVFVDVVIRSEVPHLTILANNATLHSDTPDPGGAHDTKTVAVQAVADLAVAKSSDPVKVFAGEQEKHTVKVTNNGPSDAVGVVLTDTLANEVVYEIDTALCDAAGSVLTCDIGNLPVGGEFSVDIWALVKPDTAPGTLLTNRAAVTSDTYDPNEQAPDTNNVALAENLVFQKADLKVVKFGKPDGQVRAGDILTYTVIVDNLGPSWASDVALEDLLQSSLDFELLDVTSDLAMSCSSLPAGAPSRIPVVDQRLQIDCTLLDPLAVLAVGEESPPNPGRWVLTVRVRARQTQDINNVAEVTSPAYDPAPSNNLAQVEHEITDVADLRVAKAAPAQVTAGTSMRYWLTVTNSGPSTAENVVLTDRLPPGLTVTGLRISQGSCATGTAGNAVDRLTCGFGAIGPQGEATVTIQVRVDASLRDGIVLENDAFVTSDIFDPLNANNYASALTRVETRSLLWANKAGDPQPVVAGTDLTYRIDVRNGGPSVAHNVRFTDALMAGGEYLTFLGYDIANGGGTCFYHAFQTPEVRCYLGDLAPASRRSIYLRFAVDAGTPDSTLLSDRTSWYADSGISFTEGSDFDESVAVVARADLEVQKWSDPVKVYAGEQKRYTVKVTNHGPSDAIGVTLADTLPEEVTYEIDDRGCTHDGHAVTCDVGTLPAGATWTVTIYAHVKPEVPPGTEITNTAEVTSETTDPNEDNNTATSDNLVLQKADLRIVKYGKPEGQVRAGQVLTYTVIVDNLGPSWANDVAIKDILQSSKRFDLIDVTSDRANLCKRGPTDPGVQIPATQWPPTEPPPAFGVIAPSGMAGIFQRQQIDCVLASPLEVMEAEGFPNRGRWVVTLRVRAAETQDLNNTVDATSAAYEPDWSNNHAATLHEITDVADVALEKSAPATVVAGTRLTYTLTLTNLGPSAAENAVLYDRLPAGVQVVGYVAGQGACETGTAGDASDRLTCGLGAIASGGSVSVTVGVLASPWLAEGTRLENDAYGTSDIFDPTNANNYASALTRVGAEADLEVDKRAIAPLPWIAGEVRTYLYDVSNAGPSVARDVSLFDDLPEQVGFVRAWMDIESHPGGVPIPCTISSRNGLECSLGDIDVSGEIGPAVYVDVLIDSDVPDGTEIANFARLVSDTYDPDGATAEVKVQVNALADLEVEKWSDPVKVNAGEQKRYTVRVTNHGPSDAVNVTVTDGLPAEVDYEIDTGLCQEALDQGPGGQDLVTCSFGTLEPGESAAVDIYALVRPWIAPGTVLLNRADTRSETPDPNVANNTAYSENLTLQKADLKTVKFGKPDGEVRSGEVLTYTVIVDNLGPSWANEVALKDLLQSDRKYELLGVESDRQAQCSSLPAGAPSGIARVDQRLQIDCVLDSPLEVLEASLEGPPNPGRWILTVRVTAPDTQDLDNVAEATSRIAYDPDRANNSARVEHAITDVADLAVAKSAIGKNVVGCDGDQVAVDEIADVVTAGLDLAYTIRVTNGGPSTAENVVVHDRLPPAIVVTDATVASGGRCSTGTAGESTDKLTCGLGDIDPSGTKVISVEATVDPTLADGAILENDVLVESDIFDPTNADNFAANLTTVNTAADLRLEKGHDPDTVVAGELLRYTLTVINDGPSLARDVWIYDQLPPEVAFLHSVFAACQEDAVHPGDLACSVGDLSPGETTYAYLIVMVDPDAPASIVNQAVVQSGFSDDEPTASGVVTHDPCPGDNAAGDVTPVVRKADVWIAKSEITGGVVAGTEATYRIDFGNHGPSTATGVHVRDTLPDGFVFDRCEPIDPNDQVTCTAAGQQVTLESVQRANSVVYADGDVLDAGEERGFYLVAGVSSGYILDGRTDAAQGQMCYAYFGATDYPYWAHDRAAISANEDADQAAALGRNNFDDECTRVAALADLAVAKRDDLAGFMECDPVGRGGTITYDLYVSNNGPSDAAQAYLVDWLPSYGAVLDPTWVKVSVDGGHGEVVEVRDDGRITVAVGDDPNGQSLVQLGRMNAGGVPVHVIIQVEAMDRPGVCSLDLVNSAIVETRRSDTLWPVVDGSMYAPTPTADPDPTNNRDEETTRVECPAIEVNKTISTTGECPGSEYQVIAQPGVTLTFCLEIKNTGTTYLDNIRITDRIIGTGFVHELYTDTIRFGVDEKVPVPPGETVWRQLTLPAFCQECECGTLINEVEVAADPVNVGRTRYPCLGEVSGGDSQKVVLPCAGVDTRIGLPALATMGLPPAPKPLSAAGGMVQQATPSTACESWVQVQNVGQQPTKAMLVLWGEPGQCPPQSAGPLKTECSGLLRPGSAWSFAPSLLPSGARSGIVYALNASDMVEDERGNRLLFADLACLELFDLIVGDHGEWLRFDEAYRNRGVYYGPIGPAGQKLSLDFGAHQGEPMAATVNRTCPDPVVANTTGSAAYKGISTDLLGMPDPYMGGFMYYAPMVFGSKAGLTSYLYIQNVGVQCSSLELWFKEQENCLRPVLGDVLAVAPGETLVFDASTVVGPDWLGSAWIRASQPMAMVIDTVGANHFTSYNGVPGDVLDRESGQTFSLGTQVNYAPLIYNQQQGWDTALTVQNLSSTVSAKVKVYFLDPSGGIVHTVVDWICPRGSQTFFLPVIDAIPGNWVGSARVESQEWWTPGDPLVDPPRLQSVVLLEKWSDPARTGRREAVAYNAATECDAYNWQIGLYRGGVQSGSAVLGVPLLAKANRGITTELAITNVVPKPGFTDFAIYVYDQNGLLDVVCEKLNEKQVEYIDLNTWGWVSRNFLGSAVISAIYWEHDILDDQGGFARNVVGLSAVTVERIGSAQGSPDVPGDESKAVEAFPLYNVFLTERKPACPGVPPMTQP